MIIKRKTLVIFISIVIIFLVGYININMSTKGIFNTNEYSKYEEDFLSKTTNLNLDEEITFSFEMFQVSKEKNNMRIVEHLEKNIANEKISENTKKKFEDLLIEKNAYIEMENNINLILESKGYNKTIAIISNDNVRVVSDNNLEKEDTVRILDVIVSETNLNASQIKILKFSNIEL